MKLIFSLLENIPLVVAAVSWITAGIIKMIVDFIINKKLTVSRIMGSGGMPSSHTATVVGLAIAIGKYEGVTSSFFAIAIIFMIIVIHDAIGVRLETGKHSKLLNMMMFETDAFKNLDFEQKLKEYVGHTPFQAIVGAIVGMLVAIIMLNFVYK